MKSPSKKKIFFTEDELMAKEIEALKKAEQERIMEEEKKLSQFLEANKLQRKRIPKDGACLVSLEIYY